jgi:hypothetical protein
MAIQVEPQMATHIRNRDKLDSGMSSADESDALYSRFSVSPFEKTTLQMLVALRDLYAFVSIVSSR